MTRKILMMAFLPLFICPIGAQAQMTMEQIFKKYRSVENAKYIHLPKWMMRIAANSCYGNDDIVSKTKSVRVLAIDGCNRKTREKIASSLGQLDENQYETLVKVNDDGDKCNICIRRDADKITELDIFAVDEKDVALVQLTGDFRQEDIEKAANLDF